MANKTDSMLMLNRTNNTVSRPPGSTIDKFGYPLSCFVTQRWAQAPEKCAFVPLKLQQEQMERLRPQKLGVPLVMSSVAATAHLRHPYNSNVRPFSTRSHSLRPTNLMPMHNTYNVTAPISCYCFPPYCPYCEDSPAYRPIPCMCNTPFCCHCYDPCP
jgi:hypothetical protein